MLRLFGALLCGLLILAATTAGEAPAQPQITWHGQSFFEIKSSKGTNIVIDPHLIPEYGRVINLKADVVLMSHSHNDHTQIDAIANKDKVKIIPGFKGGVGLRADWNLVNETFKDVKIRNVPLYHDNMKGLERGKVVAFVIEMDGWKIVHLGDLGHLLTKEQLKEIGPVDVLFIPIGGVYTINGEEAKQVVEQIKPKEYIIPMHYGTAVYDDLLQATEFLDEQPRERVAHLKNNTIVLNRDATRPRPLISLLHYWPQGQTKPKEKEKEKE
jgi:L-ascorbate metabolism protein UlaG (beta-lactamase superfamily)